VAEGAPDNGGRPSADLRILDGSEVTLRLDAQRRLELTLSDGTVYQDVRIAPAFPITRPNRFFYFFDSEGKEIGLLADPRRLDRESRDLLFAQADEAYFMPRITRIIRVEEQMGTGIARWEVETDRGWNAFDVVSRAESVWFVGGNRVVIRDADGNRYLIPDLNALDRRSRRLADLHL
jgi:hypothetical protein